MTRFLIAGRQEGKTTAAVRWVRGGVKRQLVVPDAMQVDWIRRHHFPGCTDLHEEKILSYSSLMSGRMRGQTRYNEIAIDNLDMMLGQLFPYHVGFITATGDDARFETNTLQIGGSS